MNRIYVTRAVECPALAEVVGWMERNGWVFDESLRGDWDRYERGDVRVVVRTMEHSLDFTRRMSELIDELASWETGESADIYDDIVKHRSEG